MKSLIPDGRIQSGCWNNFLFTEISIHFSATGYEHDSNDPVAGRHCGRWWNDCMDHGCENGATCVDRIARYECICAPGYTGELDSSRKIVQVFIVTFFIKYIGPTYFTFACPLN